MSSRLRPEVKEILDWVAEDPFKEAVLRAEAPIKLSSFLQMKNGSYIPGPQMINSLKAVKAKYPDGVSVIPGGKKAPRS